MRYIIYLKSDAEIRMFLVLDSDDLSISLLLPCYWTVHHKGRVSDNFCSEFKRYLFIIRCINLFWTYFLIYNIAPLTFFKYKFLL